MVGYPESLTDPSYQGQVSSSSSRSSFVVGVIIVRFVDRFVDRFLIICFNRDFEKNGAFPQKIETERKLRKNPISPHIRLFETLSNHNMDDGDDFL